MCGCTLVNRLKVFLLIILSLVCLSASAMTFDQYLQRIPSYIGSHPQKQQVRDYLIDLAPLLLKQYQQTFDLTGDTKAAADELDKLSELIVREYEEGIVDVYQSVVQSEAVQFHTKKPPDEFDGYSKLLDEQMLKLQEHVDKMERFVADVNSEPEIPSFIFFLDHYPLAFMVRSDTATGWFRIAAQFLRALSQNSSEEEQKSHIDRVHYSLRGGLALVLQDPDMPRGHWLLRLCASILGVDLDRGTDPVPLTTLPQLLTYISDNIPGVDTDSLPGLLIQPMPAVNVQEDSVSLDHDEDGSEETESPPLREAEHDEGFEEIEPNKLSKPFVLQMEAFPRVPERLAHLLSRLASFSSDPHGKPRLELYGSHALSAWFQELYQQSGQVFPADWDFKIYSKDLGPVLEQLEIPEEHIKHCIESGSKAGVTDLPVFAIDGMNVGLYIMRSGEDKSSWSGVSVKWYIAKETGDGYDLALAIDLNFTDQLNAIQSVLFESLVPIPIIKIEAILNHFKQLLQDNQLGVEKHIRRIQQWQEMERKHSKLPEALREMLMELLIRPPKKISVEVSQVTSVQEIAEAETAKIEYRPHQLCRLCKQGMVDPHQVPTCGTRYCRHCIDTLEDQEEGRKLCVCDFPEECSGSFAITDIRKDRRIAKELEKLRVGENPDLSYTTISAEVRDKMRPKFESFVSLGMGLEKEGVPVEQKEVEALTGISTAKDTATLKSIVRGKSRGCDQLRDRKQQQDYINQILEKAEGDNLYFEREFTPPELLPPGQAYSPEYLEQEYLRLEEAIRFLTESQEECNRGQRIKSGRNVQASDMDRAIFRCRKGVAINWNRLARYAKFMGNHVYERHAAAFSAPFLSIALRWDSLSVILASQFQQQIGLLWNDFPAMSKAENVRDTEVAPAAYLEKMFWLVYESFSNSLQFDLQTIDPATLLPLEHTFTAPVLGELMGWRTVLENLDSHVSKTHGQTLENLKFLIVRMQVFGFILMDLDKGLDLMMQAMDLHDQLIAIDEGYLFDNEFQQLQLQFIYGATIFMNLVLLLDWSSMDNAPYLDRAIEVAQRFDRMRVSNVPENATPLQAMLNLGSRLKIQKSAELQRRKSDHDSRTAASEKAAKELLDIVEKENRALEDARKRVLQASSTGSQTTRTVTHKSSDKDSEKKVPSQEAPSRKKKKVPRWEREYNQARDAFQKNQFDTAVGLYGQAAEHCQNDMKPFMLVGQADARKRSLDGQLPVIIRVLGDISSYLNDFKKLELPHHRLSTTRDQLMGSIRSYTELTEAHSKTVELIITGQQNAYQQLLGIKTKAEESIGDVEANIWFLSQEIKALMKIQEEMNQGFQNLAEILQLRRQWLKGIRENGVFRGVMNRDTLGVLERLDEAHSRHEGILERTRIFQKLLNQHSGASTKPVARVQRYRLPPGYQEITITGDGNCLFSAMARGMNSFGQATTWTQAKIRELIHRILKKLVAEIENNVELQAELATVLGQSFDLLEISVENQTLLDTFTHGLCPEGILQQYGDATVAALIPLVQPVQFSVSVHGLAPQVNGLNLWLRYARNLLRALVLAGIVDLSHWPDQQVLLDALDNQEAADQLAQQIEAMNMPAVLVHTNTNPLLQHFNLAVNPAFFQQLPAPAPALTPATPATLQPVAVPSNASNSTELKQHIQTMEEGIRILLPGVNFFDSLKME